MSSQERFVATATGGMAYVFCRKPTYDDEEVRRADHAGTLPARQMPIDTGMYSTRCRLEDCSEGHGGVQAKRHANGNATNSK